MRLGTKNLVYRCVFVLLGHSRVTVLLLRFERVGMNDIEGLRHKGVLDQGRLQ